MPPNPMGVIIKSELPSFRVFIYLFNFDVRNLSAWGFNLRAF